MFIKNKHGQHRALHWCGGTSRIHLFPIIFLQHVNNTFKHTSQQANPRTAVNSPHSGQSRRSPGALAGIPRISPGPCLSAGGVTHHLLPEDTGAESQNGTLTPEPTWGRCGSQVETARPHSGWGARRSGLVCGLGRSEPNRLNSATSCPKTHVENSSSGVLSVYLLSRVLTWPRLSFLLHFCQWVVWLVIWRSQCQQEASAQSRRTILEPLPKSQTRAMFHFSLRFSRKLRFRQIRCVLVWLLSKVPLPVVPLIPSWLQGYGSSLRLVSICCCLLSFHIAHAFLVGWRMPL